MDSPPKWFRIGQLEKLSGVNRRTIHFYLKEGLLPPPMKTGKTMSYYDETHLKRLKAIAESKEEGLPLFAIRERLSEMEEEKSRTPAQVKNPSSKKALPKSAQGNRTREAVLELGCRLFRQKGYKNTKVSDITKRLNVGKGTFYFYFTDKKELFLECVPRIFAEIFSTGWEKIAKENDPAIRLKIRGQLVWPVLGEFCSILSLSKEAMEDPDPKLRKLGEQIYASIWGPVVSDIKKGIAMGRFRQVDPKVHASIIIGATEGLHHLFKHHKDVPAGAYDDAIFHLFAKGIMTDAPEPPGEAFA
ncbi:MAG: MerR family transcriptional regulator [Deltaproteobacteria bacterium]|nr:MerR family transcriptional regulator [Deltaproteobacteria bacterium]